MQRRNITLKSKAKRDIYRRTKAVSLDTADASILRELIADARLPLAELARRVKLSPPSVGERLRRLEEAGVITGYHAAIDPSKLGFALTLIIRARPSPGMMEDMIRAMDATKQIVRCERISGDDCFIAWAHVRDVTEMEAVIDRLVPFGATNSSVVQSAPIPDRKSFVVELCRKS